MEENKEMNTEYTGEYGNLVEHNDTPQADSGLGTQAETQDSTQPALQDNVQADAAGGEGPDTTANSTYSYSYRNGQGESTHSGDYYEGHNPAPQRNTGCYQAPQGNVPPKQKPKKQKSETTLGKKILACALFAAVFGLVAGVCFQGVRYMTDRFMPSKSVTRTQLKSTTDGADVADSAQSSQAPAVTQMGTTDVSGIVEQTMPAIVAITSTTQGENYYDLFGREYQGRDSTGSGSGFIVGQNDKELLIATNNHVIDGAKTISVQFIDEEVYEASVKGSDSSNDLAVIAVPVSKIKEATMEKIRVADLGNSENVKVGEMAIAIGNALGYGQSVTVGYISAKDREITESESQSSQSSQTIKAIQTDAAINPGNSGGALLNMQGQVIGINSAKIAASEVEGVGYAIPISVANPIIEELMNKEVLKDSEKGYLGISGKTVTDEVAGFNVPNGVYVAEVAKDGAAEKAGIQQGDIITSINNMEVRTIESLQEKANSYKKGTEVEITLQRSDKGSYKEKKVKVKLQGADSLDNLDSGSNSNDNQQSDGNSGNTPNQNPNNGNGDNNGNSDGNNDNGGSRDDGNGWFDFGDFFGN